MSWDGVGGKAGGLGAGGSGVGAARRAWRLPQLVSVSSLQRRPSVKDTRMR